jgi:flagellar hook-basal body complex protein FliE
MSIAPITGVTGVAPVLGPGATPSASAPSRAGASFATSLAGAVDDLQQLQSTSNQLAVQAVTGSLDDIHTAVIAASRAQVTLELAAAVRNKGVDAFNEIMRMQA